VALLIDGIYEGLGLLGRSRIEMAQKPLEGKRAAPYEVGWIFDGLLRYALHNNNYLTATVTAVLSTITSI
jgi:hypothetical protein